MNTGQQSVEWLYHEQLKVDDEWAVRTPNGFKWWADKNAQTIEVVGEEIGPDGDIGYLISVRTDFLRNLELTDRSLAGINLLLMSFASMAGPVYDTRTRTLALCSLVRVHQGISAWINRLISVAAVLQIAEARIMAHEVAKTLDAQEAISGHPRNGMRPHPDEMAEAVASVIAPLGKQPSKWSAREFQDVVDNYMQQPPSLGASAGGLGCCVEFPYGDQSSLCRIKADQPHPRLGNGLFLLHSFPVSAMSDAEGARLALSLNATELAEKPSGYGFGSFAFGDGDVHFTSFIPNATYRPGMLPNLYFSCAQRAREMSLRLTNRDWNAESFDLRRSAIGRIGRLFDRDAKDDADVEAQYQLGIKLANDAGGTQDYKLAAFWLEKAALQGHAGAQISLGILYNDGRGVAQDYKRAMALWEQAAAQGDATAQYNLGDMYCECRGVTQDYVEEFKWFSLAADNGDPDAAKCRDTVKAKMTQQQIAEAQRRAKEWLKANE